MLCLSISTSAQQMITSDLEITKPMYFHQLNGSNFKLDPATHKGTLRVFVSGKYLTYEVELSGPVFEEANKANNKSGDKTYFTWTGSTDYMNAALLNGNTYLVADTQRRMDGLFAEKEGNWMFLVTGQLSNCITDIHTGCTVSDVKNGLKGLGQVTAFKETGVVGSLTEYTMYGAKLHDHPILDKTDVRKDDPYAKFYFDKNGKLVKWFMMKR